MAPQNSSSAAPGRDEEDLGSLPRPVVYTLVALIGLFPIVAAVVVLVMLTRPASDPSLPPLMVGACVHVDDDQRVTDVECPGGNGRVVSVGTSTLQCSSAAAWAIIRDAHTYCIQRTAVDPVSL